MIKVNIINNTIDVIKDGNVVNIDSITKNKDIEEELRKVLDVYIKDLKNQDFLFRSQKKTDTGKARPIDRTRAYRILTEAAEEIGYPEPIGTHSMRKTFGYNFYEKYKEVASLMKIFNHSKETTTLFYIGVGQDDLDEKMAGLYR